MTLAYLSFIPTFAVLDRWCGGGMGWRSTFVGRPLYYVVALTPAAFLLDWKLGTVLLGWCFWRAPAWSWLGGSLTPKGYDQIIGTFMRHFFGVWAVSLAAAGCSDKVQVAVIGLLACWAVVATAFAIWNRNLADLGQDANGFVEFTRGAWFGVMACYIMWLLEARCPFPAS